MKKKIIKPATLHSVVNKNRHNAASSHYNMMILDRTGEVLFFTDSDLIKALDRAEKNQEDIPPYTISECYNPIVVGCCLFGVGIISFILGIFLGDLGLYN
jgi:hypothetical protein